MAEYKNPIIKVPRFSEENGFYTTAQRSAMMSKIRSHDTKPEQKLRKFLWGLGIRYRKNVKKLPGRPDIVLSKFKLVIFIDGEFWHGYNWEEKKEKIKSNRGFWIPKIERNMQRDEDNNQFYQDKGWKVMRFWDSEIKKEFAVCVNCILDYIEDYMSENQIKHNAYPNKK